MPAAPRPQYLLSPPPFRFKALARLAGSLPLGQGREAAITLLLVARLAAAALEADPAPVGSARRAAAARAWLPGSCPDRVVRQAATAVCQAIEAGDPMAIAQALAAAAEAAAPWLTTAAKAEVVAVTRARPVGSPGAPT
jgi:hypothetical protein